MFDIVSTLSIVCPVFFPDEVLIVRTREPLSACLFVSNSKRDVKKLTDALLQKDKGRGKRFCMVSLLTTLQAACVHTY